LNHSKSSSSASNDLVKGNGRLSHGTIFYQGSAFKARQDGTYLLFRVFSFQACDF
jgi:hypothetical protein